MGVRAWFLESDRLGLTPGYTHWLATGSEENDLISLGFIW